MQSLVFSFTGASALHAEPGCFPSLVLLDLTHNRIAEEGAVLPLGLLPSLHTLLLAGNPLAVRQTASKRQDRCEGAPILMGR